jgi:hypothetical protein
MGIRTSVHRPRRSALAAVPLALLLSCGGSAEQGSIDLAVDGVDYHLAWATLVYQPLPDGRAFLSLGQDPLRVNIVRAVPGGGIQWRMTLSDPTDLEGVTVDLSNPRYEGLVTFTLTDDLALVSLDPDPRVRLHFGRVRDGLAVGRFEAEGFHRLNGDELGPPLRFEGRFEARIDAD